MKKRLIHLFVIGIFCSLYFLVATISMINSVAFFDLAHDNLMNWALAIGFELGAAASLAAIIILEKTNKAMVWGLFILLTAFQMMANTYHAYVNLENYLPWIELFGLQEEELIYQKRILSIVSGAILPIVALGFIKSLVDYIRPEKDESRLESDSYSHNIGVRIGHYPPTELDIYDAEGEGKENSKQKIKEENIQTEESDEKSSQKVSNKKPKEIRKNKRLIYKP